MSTTDRFLPFEPMTPIACDSLPEGDDWGYQLKWDGVRIISCINGSRVSGADDAHDGARIKRALPDEARTATSKKRDAEKGIGSIRLLSRKMLDKSRVYPEIIRYLRDSLTPEHTAGGIILDGEAVVFDPKLQRPVFQLVLQRERSEATNVALAKWPVVYVLFDILCLNGEDLRPLPYSERHRRLLALFPERRPHLFVSDLFSDGAALWDWVERNGWEGVVAKRLSAPYRSGKKHRDWFKKKTALTLDVTIAGIVVRGGQAASMVMLLGDVYVGRVSLGLSGDDRRRLLHYAGACGGARPPFSKLPAELSKEEIIWLNKPFRCRVTGLEITAAGVLRHPKLLSFDLPDA